MGPNSGYSLNYNNYYNQPIEPVAGKAKGSPAVYSVYFNWFAFSNNLSTTLFILSNTSNEFGYRFPDSVVSKIIRCPLPWSKVPSNFLSRIISDSFFCSVATSNPTISDMY